MRLSDLPPATLGVIGHLIRGEGGSNQGIDPDAELPEPTGYHVLCLQYRRPDSITTPGGMVLHLAAQTIKEDEYQGRLGIVVALGPDAYSDQNKFPSGPWVEVGDVVAWPALENASGRYSFGGGTLCAVTDDRLVMKRCSVKHMVGR